MKSPQPERLRELLASHPILASLKRVELDGLIERCRVVSLGARRTFIKEGDPPHQAYCLLAGSVRVFHRRGPSQEVLLKLFRAPALFGEMEVLSGLDFMEFVSTLEPSELLAIPAAELHRLVTQDHGFAAALAFDLSARLCVATHNIRALAFSDLDARLATLLLDYAQLCGEATKEGIRIPLRLSQDQMARDLGVSRRGLGIALVRLRRMGFVAKERARFVIRDAARLKDRRSSPIGVTYSSRHSVAQRGEA